MPVDQGIDNETLERSLIVRAKSGEREAFSQLIRLNIQRVYRTAFAVLRNHDDAEDVAQETFVRAYQSIARFDESRPLFPWLFRIARNLCLNRIERVSKRETAVAELDYLTDSSPTPEQSAVATEDLNRVREAVARLPDQHREIIQLSHFQECSYREIAEILDIPIGTVMSRLYNARKKLKSLLEETEDG